jgi:hypothetical protein
MSVQYVVTAPPTAVYVPPTVSPEAVRTLRAKLKAMIRQAWDSPEGQALANALSSEAQSYGRELEALYENTGFDKQIKAIAEKHDISGKYKRLWGKV